ncbi:SHOOT GRAVITROPISM-like protein [Parasponia andersonii]|uniref:SHOOT GRAVITROPISM-like protein n=1 Tax=Parasponia andersonii TaxID=3476 RepID=A0A2P5DVJ9_PARAD|nr:SHOOT GRAVITROPISM-like protein [Parasponia andersonii]
MEEDDQKELQLLPAHPQSSVVPSRPLDHAANPIIRYNRSKGSSRIDHHHKNHRRRPFNGPGLDLQLSISLRPTTTTTSTNDLHHPRKEDCRTVLAGPICECVDDQDLKMAGDDDEDDDQRRCVEALKWQAAEQIRLAAMEKAYAERVRELTRREMELAQSEFARARHMWETAREEVEKAERLKERATTTSSHQMHTNSNNSNSSSSTTCMEITCQSCRQRFRP